MADHPSWHRQEWLAAEIEPLVQQLVNLRSTMLALEARAEPLLRPLGPERRVSGRNLLHYLALRRQDIRPLQEELVARGLSSLGRCEAYVMANLEAVLGILSAAAPPAVPRLPADAVPVSYAGGRGLLHANSQALFGSTQPSDPPIMVTMATQAATDYPLVRDLLAAGMSVMRINAAHDDAAQWSAMIAHLRQAEKELGRTCRVAMDLAGPKIRTGPIEPGPRVISWNPRRDELGRMVAPARIILTPHPELLAAAADGVAVVPIAADWWRRVQVGDWLRFRDAAGRKRKLLVTQATEQGLWAESDSATYLTPETLLRHYTGTEDGNSRVVGDGQLGPIPSLPSYLFLRRGDRLLVTDSTLPGRPAQYDHHGRLLAPARIGCTLSEIFRDVKPGERVLLDDGKIGCVVVEASAVQILLEVTRCRPAGQRLRADKGMNFPDTQFQLPALTEKDIADLAFAAQHADIVNYSFVRRPEDIRHLHQELARLGRPDLAIILKIENRQAFENLPLLLLEVMQAPAATGVMVARGDLAVECGWERLVEVQEEILWMCEAAHQPVVWATQVLESLAKSGLPTRAEVTDAGMGARTECVMLNKGPNIVETVHALHDILRRMQSHQVKKRPTFRRLKVADRLFATDATESIPAEA